MAEAEQEEGWPLGLRPLDARAEMVRNRNANGSLSFNTILTSSSISSSDCSSDLETQSTGSFFHDKSITLGSLIGISSILELSRRSTRRIAEPTRNRKNYRIKKCFFSLCSRLSTDAVSTENTLSLGHFLEAERRAAGSCRRNPGQVSCGPDGISHVLISNSSFVGGRIAPP